MNENQQQRKYTFGEAFALMRYRDKVTGAIEVIWNSRDGITPMFVSSRAGNESSHVEWDRDVCAPDHVPSVGDRIFVTMTEARARELATETVEKRWDVPLRVNGSRMRDHFASKEEAIATLADDWVKDWGGGAPDIIVVTEENRLQFVRAAGAA